METIKRNNWNFKRMSSLNFPIITVDSNKAYKECLNYFDNINQIYCSINVKNNAFLRYHNELYTTKSKSLKNQTLKNFPIKIIDYTKFKKEEFNKKLGKILKLSENLNINNNFNQNILNIKSSYDYNVIKLPSNLIHDGVFNNNKSRINLRKLVLPSSRLIYTNRLQIKFKNTHIHRLLKLLNIPNEYVKTDGIGSDNVVFYPPSFEEYERIAIQLNTLS